MDDQEISTPADDFASADPTPTAASFANLAALMQQMAESGWVWEEKAHRLTHPRAPQLSFHVDPATRRLTVSAGLAERLNLGLGPQPQEGQP